MPDHLTVVFEISWDFREALLLQYMRVATEKKRASRHEKRLWSINGLTVKQYEKTLLVQGSLNDGTRQFLRGLRGIPGLSLDVKNARIWLQVFPAKHNAILCPECKATYLLIQGQMEGLDIIFKGECGHKDNLTPPVLMLNNRILPDLNILVSKSLSRIINLGYLVGFEVVLPDFILDLVDQFKGSSRKNAVSDELTDLMKLGQEGKIKINNLSSIPFKIDAGVLGDEDKVILELAKLTNAILFTSDELLKDRAMMQDRPTLYVSPEDFGRIKMIEEVRTP